MTLPQVHNIGKRILAIIPARGKSKGIPLKNIHPVNGKPLIYYTIEAAKGVPKKLFCEVYEEYEEYEKPIIMDVVVSSDDDRILSYAKDNGVSIIKRPEEISGDSSICEEVVTHCIKEYKKKAIKFDYIMLLQPTSPLRGSEIITRCIEQLNKFKSHSSLITVFKNEHSPYKAVKLNKKGELESAFGVKEYLTRSRQELPETFMPNGAVYIVETELFMSTKSFFHKDTQLFIMDREQSVDIDTLADVDKVEEYMRKKETVI